MGNGNFTYDIIIIQVCKLIWVYLLLVSYFVGKGFQPSDLVLFSRPLWHRECGDLCQILMFQGHNINTVTIILTCNTSKLTHCLILGIVLLIPSNILTQYMSDASPGTLSSPLIHLCKREIKALSNSLYACTVKFYWYCTWSLSISELNDMLGTSLNQELHLTTNT